MSEKQPGAPHKVSGPKMSRKSISMDVKLQVIRRLEAGERQVDVGASLNLATATIRTIIKNADKIKASATTTSNLLLAKVTRSRSHLLEKMENRLNIWLDEQTQQHVSVSQLYIMEKARSIFNEIQEEEQDNSVTFTASRGWFDRFKQRSNLRSIRSSSVKDLNQDTNEELAQVQIKSEAPDLEYDCNNTEGDSFMKLEFLNEELCIKTEFYSNNEDPTIAPLENKLFHCDLCSYKCNAKAAFERHFLRSHSEEKLTHSGENLTHSGEKSTHSGEKPEKPSQSSEKLFKSGLDDFQPVYNCCVLCELLSKDFTAFNYHQKVLIIQNGRPTPSITNLITKIKSFKAEIYKSCDWLTGCENSDKLYCWPCILFASESNIWNRTGINDLNNLHKIIKKHSNSKTHLECVVKEKTFIKTPIHQELIFEYNKKVKKNREIFKRLIKAVLYLIEHGGTTNYESYVELLKLIAKFDEVLKNHLEYSSNFRCDSNQIHDDLFAAIVNVTIKKIQNEIQEASFVAIILNGGDTRNIIARYVASSGEVQERFLSFQDKNIQELLFELDLGDKLVAQSYDGDVVAPSELDSLQANIKQNFPNAHFLPCFVHDLYLIFKQSLGFIQPCKVFFSNLNLIVEFFSNQKHSQALELEINTPISWVCNTKILANILEFRQQLINFFKNLISRSDDWDSDAIMSSRGLLSLFKTDFDFNFFLILFSELFSCFDEDLAIIDVNLYVKNLEEFKNAVNKNKERFDLIWDQTKSLDEEFNQPEMKKLCLGLEIDSRTSLKKFVNEIIENLLLQINLRLNSCENLKFLELTNFNGFKNNIFPESAFDSLQKSYGNCFDFSSLRSQLSVIYSTGEINKNNSGDLLLFIKQYGLEKSYSEVTKLCELMLTIPTSLCASSALERIKNYVGRSTKEESLSNLAVLSIEKCFVKRISEYSEFFEDVIKEFVKIDSSNIALNFK